MAGLRGLGVAASLRADFRGGLFSQLVQFEYVFDGGPDRACAG